MAEKKAPRRRRTSGAQKEQASTNSVENPSTVSAVGDPKRTVTVSQKFTKNLGNYNSFSSELSITLPINPTKRDILEATESAEVCSNLVKTTLEEHLAKHIDGWLDSSREYDSDNNIG
ncbi:hypothetical protein [Flammeovirga agarivorans]|uniref:Uncharacterized protein n=1 Tax=Flammeovirga agarivorans TaxID=2726742 RepID=A0A7X8XZ88_9BACT|nr:hypothetical protein [Flammeovirga agarivorans]NLR94936.1 hypothetical protein [Flammeovirga agarivorans]